MERHWVYVDASDSVQSPQVVPARPVRECLLEVRFHPAMIPTSCRPFRTPELDSRRHPPLLRPSAVGSVHAVAPAERPCHFGIRWDWGQMPCADGRSTDHDPPYGQ